MKNTIIIIAFFLCTISTSAQVSVIANNSISESTLKADMVSRIYSLDLTKWNNGSKVVVVEQSTESGVKNKFYSFISRDPIALKKEWLKKQITGEAKPPVNAATDQDVIRIVSSTPGAIGYIKTSSVNSSVKVVSVIP